MTFLVIDSKMSVYPDKFCHLQLNSRQITLFRLKSHHFRTYRYFLYMIRNNNVSQPIHDPTTPVQNLGVVTPKPPGLTPMGMTMTVYVSLSVKIDALSCLCKMSYEDVSLKRTACYF